jgi:outer membrane protein assembly factor BamB
MNATRRHSVLGSIPTFLAIAALLSAEVTLPASAANPPGVSGWKIEFDPSRSNPVAADGVLYIGAGDGAVYALDLKTGATLWRHQTGEDLAPQNSGPLIVTVPAGTSVTDALIQGPGTVAGTGTAPHTDPDADDTEVTGRRRVEMTPAVDNGTVFVGSEDKSFYAIDAATGKKKWSYPAGQWLGGPPAIVKNGVVYFTSEQGLHAVDVLTGKRKWRFETLPEISKGNWSRPPSAPVLSDGVFFLTAWPYGNDAKSFLYAVNLETGKPKWVTTVDGGTFMGDPVTAKDLVFFSVIEKGSDTTYRNGKRIDGKATPYAVDVASGQRSGRPTQ